MNSFAVEQLTGSRENLSLITCLLQICLKQNLIDREMFNVFKLK
jgi:hypothetical protein